MKSFFSFLLALIFMVHTMAFAYEGDQSNHKKFVNAYANYYNSLTVQQFQEEFSFFIKKRSSEEQAWFKKNVEVSKLPAPHLDAEGDSLKLTYQKQTFTIKRISQNLLEINGKTIEFKKGEFSKTINQLEEVIQMKTFSVSDFFFSPAYAASTEAVVTISATVVFLAAAILGFPEEVITLGALTAIGGGVSWMIYGIKSFNVKHQCSSIRDQVNNLAYSSNREEDIKSLKISLLRSKSDIKNAPACSRSDRKDLCKQVKDCLDSIQEELKVYDSKINTSERGTVKDESVPAKASPNQMTGASKQ